MDQTRDDFLACARFARDQNRDGGGGDAPNRREKLAHLLRDEECAELLFDGILRPQRRPPPLVFSISLEFHRCAAHAKNVLHQDRLSWRLRHLARNRDRLAAHRSRRTGNMPSPELSAGAPVTTALLTLTSSRICTISSARSRGLCARSIALPERIDGRGRPCSLVRRATRGGTSSISRSSDAMP